MTCLLEGSAGQHTVTCGYCDVKTAVLTDLEDESRLSVAVTPPQELHGAQAPHEQHCIRHAGHKRLGRDGSIIDRPARLRHRQVSIKDGQRTQLGQLDKAS